LTQAETQTFCSGLNYLSGSNRFYQEDSVTESDFAFFKANNISSLSIRIVWKSFVEDHDNVTSNYKRILTIAEDYGLKVQFDFWTWFNESSPKPTFLTSVYDTIRNSTAKQLWLDFVSEVINEFKSYDCVESWTMMNEPLIKMPSDEALFYQCWNDQRTLMKSIDSRPVSIRFALGDSPWSGDFNKSEVFQLCDYIAINEYLDPSDESYTIKGGNWTMFNECVSDCENNHKPLVITEFGSDTGDDADKRMWYEQSLALFKSKGIQKAYSWAWQTTNPESERYSIAGSPPEPAFYELSEAAATPKPTPSPTVAPTPTPTPISTPTSTPTHIPIHTPTPTQTPIVTEEDAGTNIQSILAIGIITATTAGSAIVLRKRKKNN